MGASEREAEDGMEKLARGIVKGRIFFLVLFVVLAIISVFCIGKTTINFDLTQYLRSDTMTRRSLIKMQEEFGTSEQLRLMFQDVQEDEIARIFDEINDRDEVLAAVCGADDIRESDGSVYRLMTLTLAPCDAAQLVQDLRAQYPGACVGGAAANQLDIQQSVGQEVGLALALSVVIVLLMLLLTSHAWFEPVIILITLGISILINMGTNFVFPSVSFITYAVCAILQLALSIDYAVMLLNGYHNLLEQGLHHEDAMVGALRDCMMPISSSALTTAAGLLSLLFMSFTIGFDIGLVLTKGIFISMVTVFLFMPGLTLLLRKAIHNTRHKPLPLGGNDLGRAAYKLRVPIAVLLSLFVIVCGVLQTQNTYLFSDVDNISERTEGGRIQAVFGASDPLVLLVPGDDSEESYVTQRQLVSGIEAVLVDGQPVVQQITAMVTTGAAALAYYTPEQVAEMTGMPAFTVRLFFNMNGLESPVRADKLLEKADALGSLSQIKELRETLAQAKEAFQGPHYARMLIELNVSSAGEEAQEAIRRIMALAEGLYGEDYYMTGTGMSVYDIGHAFTGDLRRVNLITLAAIFLIVALSFRSLSVPLVLVFVIEGAIWISMAISKLTHQPIFFISYLICVSIQMGATIDYGILLTDHYRALRQTLAPKPALMEALRLSLPTVLTSGIILVTAGFTVGKVCSIYYISSIGLLLSRGALISVILVLTLLPALLVLLDRFVSGVSRR